MSDPLRSSIDKLELKLADQEAAIRKTKNAINVLYEELGEDPPYMDLAEKVARPSSLRQDQFFGKPFATAVKELLKTLGRPVTVKEIVEGLKRGGFDFGKTKELDRAVSISLGKNTQSFVQLPNSDAFGLLEWYPDVRKPVKREAKDRNGNDQDASKKEVSSTLDEISDVVEE